jgi:hypothetical protein
MLYRKERPFVPKTIKIQDMQNCPVLNLAARKSLGLKGLIIDIYTWRHEKVSARRVEWVEGSILRATRREWLQRREPRQDK